MLNFIVTDSQQEKINKWLMEELYPEVIKGQKELYSPEDPFYRIVSECWEAGYPYSGAIGGGIQYIFSPTSIGDILVIKNSWNDMEFNATEYDMW